MQTFKLSYPHTYQLTDLPETVAAIGFFDGIHLGHQQVIKRAVAAAKERNMASAVITFHPHPSVVLNNKAEKVKYITPLADKQELIAQLQVDRLYMIEFNHELSLLSPKQFLDHFIHGLHIKHLIAGFDFTFGHKGEGNMQNIESFMQHDFSYTIIPKVEQDNKKISSTNIRAYLTAGQIELANEMLGRPFSIRGQVVYGDQRGRTIGYPTANLEVENDTLLPKSGVYAVKVVYQGELYEGMANIGVKPTFKDDLKKPSVEVNIFNFNKQIYGEEIHMQLFTFIREEKKFAGVEELVSQIQQDEREIKAFFNIDK